MGQQQLLLIVLSVIIVGVAVSVGVNMFQSGAVDANRQALVSDVVNYAAKAQRHYRTPEALAGGGQNFDGFKLQRLDTANANGVFTISTSKPNDKSGVSGSISPISGSSGTIAMNEFSRLRPPSLVMYTHATVPRGYPASSAAICSGVR